MDDTDIDEMAAGKQRFLTLVRDIDPAVQVVIPVTPSNSLFLISLTKGANRKFISVHEDDLLDLPIEASARTKISRMVQETIHAW
jgi:hypothetical protein